MPIDMTYREKERIEGTLDNGWMNDVVLDNAMSMIKHEFPHIQGLQSVSLANVAKYKRCSSKDQVLQIMNTELQGTGEHWVLISTFDTEANTVRLYDSTNACYLNDRMKKAIANLVKADGDLLKVEFIHSDEQTNSYDCGIYAIANMVALANGMNPSNMVFDVEQMRSTLLTSFEVQNMQMFPHIIDSGEDKGRLSVEIVEVFCSCKMTDDSRMYFECEACENWYHPGCQGYGHKSDKQIEKETLYCRGCIDNNYVPKRKKGRHNALDKPKNHSPKPRSNKKTKRRRY